MPEGASSNDQDVRDDPLRVIIADDDPFARKMIKEALQRAGLIVIAEAHNGRQAVELKPAGNGRYTAPVSLPASGQWEVHVTAEVKGQQYQLAQPMEID